MSQHPPQRRLSSLGQAALVGTLTLSLAGLGIGPAAAENQPVLPSPAEGGENSAPAVESLNTAEGRVAAYIEFADIQPAAERLQEQYGEDFHKTAPAPSKRSRLSEAEDLVASKAQDILEELPEAEWMYETGAALTGVAVVAEAADLRLLLEREDIAAIHLIPEMEALSLEPEADTEGEADEEPEPAEDNAGTEDSNSQDPAAEGSDTQEPGSEDSATEEDPAAAEEDAAAENSSDTAEETAEAEPDESAAEDETEAEEGSAYDPDRVELSEGGEEPELALEYEDEISSNSGNVIHTATTEAWWETGVLGEGVTIAVIDSGIDYTHATFNDSDDAGTVEAYQAARHTGEVDWPQGNVINGWDFVGDDYTGTPGTAQPDPNPIDTATGSASGHGTHVAATAAGRGVDAEGQTFTGDYAELDNHALRAFDVGPGAAPEAQLVALKVFGRDGSTQMTTTALDWVYSHNLDPTAFGGDEDDFIDVVNLSLGGTFPTPDMPEARYVEQLAEMGVTVVSSAGNSGDLPGVSGFPAAATDAIAVASSVSGQFFYDGAEFYFDDAEEPEVIAGQASVNFSGPGMEEPAELVALDPENSLAYLSGCEPLTAEDAELVAGKVLMLAWDDDTALPCGSTPRFEVAAAAGAAGVVLTSTLSSFGTGIGGNAETPGVQVLAEDLARFAEYDPSTGAIELTREVQVRLDPAQYNGSVPVSIPDAADTVSSFTSRGNPGSFGLLKPDLAAPGTSVTSARTGTGNGSSTSSGTSMASPFAAGVAALAVQAHGWDSAGGWLTAQRHKALLMNTSSHTVSIEGTEAGPQRIGAGRIDGGAAVANRVIAYDAQNPGLVSMAFDPVDAAEELSVSRDLVIENHHDEDVTLELAYQAQQSIPGVTFQVPSSAAVPAGGSTEVTVTLNVSDVDALRKVIDPTMDLADPALQGIFPGLVRNFLASEQGWIQLSGAPEAETLHVPVNANVRPASTTTGADVVFDEGSAESVLSLSGSGLAQGEGHERYESLTAPFQLGATREATDPEQLSTPSAAAVDLAAVGTQYFEVGGTEMIGIGIATHHDWGRFGAWDHFIIERETEDTVFQAYVGLSSINDITADSTMVSVDACSLGTATCSLQGRTLPFLRGGHVDTRPYDSNVMQVAFPLAWFGATAEELEAGEAAFEFSVYGNNRSGQVSALEGVTFSQQQHLLFGDADDGIFSTAAGQTDIPVTRPEALIGVGDEETEGEHAQVAQLLLLHPHNAGTENRWEIVDALEPRDQEEEEDDDAAAEWSSSTAYAEGDQVRYDGRVFEALWYSQNQVPGESAYSAWSEIGAETQCGGETVNAWAASTRFLGGETVTHDGELYTAKWYSRNQEPGDPYGPWDPVGSC